jgi:hypothetical protein
MFRILEFWECIERHQGRFTSSQEQERSEEEDMSLHSGALARFKKNLFMNIARTGAQRTAFCKAGQQASLRFTEIAS